MSREITIGVCNECQDCDLMKFKPYRSYTSVLLPYCTLFKTYLQFREYENDDLVIRPCFECNECSQGNTHYFTTGEWKEK